MLYPLSPDQEDAKAAVIKWFKASSPTAPVFKLHGYAGTGKTTAIRSIISDLNISAVFAAYTGKAAMVMRKQGLDAKTLHSLIYKPIPPDQDKCNKLFKQLSACSPGAAEKKRIKAELVEAQKVAFELRDLDDGDLPAADLLVVDECSMVNEDMLADLLTFKVPVLALGDPGQLPPIHGEGALTSGKPDALLTQIHRQAEGNPIIDFATRARHGIPIPQRDFADSTHRALSALTEIELLGADQILCGKNATRMRINQQVRALLKHPSLYPYVGEKLISLRNAPALGLFNGTMCEVVAVKEEHDASWELEVVPEGGTSMSPKPVKVRALKAYFEQYHDKDALENVRWWERRDAHDFDFGYAITVHKAQGSQWDRVLIVDDKMLIWKPADRRRWLYTAITRAAETVQLYS